MLVYVCVRAKVRACVRACLWLFSAHDDLMKEGIGGEGVREGI